MNDDLQRLARVLEAYGANAERWPEEERDALLSLVSRNASAQQLVDEANRTDALLDVVAGVNPMSADLADRISRAVPDTTAPAKRRWRSWAPLFPLAAAAALALWISRAPTDPVIDPPPVQIAIADLGEFGNYETPTDVLLVVDGFDSLESVPSYTCDGNELGCIELDFDLPEASRQSWQQDSRRWTT